MGTMVSKSGNLKAEIRAKGQRLKVAGRISSVDPVKNTSMYEGCIKGPTADWFPSVFTGNSQHVIFEGLTPGTIYTIQVRALGGSTGESDRSDPSSHMVM
jgi:hypothetical protein